MTKKQKENLKNLLNGVQKDSSKVYLTFTINEDQQKKTMKFKKHQDKIYAEKNNIKPKEVDSYIEYRFVSGIGGIGIGTEVYHSLTKNKLDITDYDCW